MFTSSTINLQDLQRLLFGVAYKMIGEVAASEDIVQDTMAVYLSKSSKKEWASVQNVTKYLIKTATNRSINYLKKAKKERVHYFGEWLPEPILNETQNIDFQIDMNYGMTFLLSRLSPKERAVFILKNAFDFTFKEIGETLQLKEATCRKIFQRLQPKLQQKTGDRTMEKAQKERLLQAFLAVKGEDGLEQLIAILKEDIVLYSDGGGQVSAAKHPLVGVSVCSKFLLGLFKKKGTELTPIFAIVNGEPALQLNDANGNLDTIILFEMENTQINRLYFIRNPDKLRIL